MHILLIHQAFAAIDEPGGTRHHELSLHLAQAGHKVTVIASPISYLTGKSSAASKMQTAGNANVEILRAPTYAALHKSFVHRVFSFLSFMWSSFWLGIKVRNIDLVWGTSPPIFQGITSLLLAKLKRTPFMFEVRDLWPEFAVAVGVLKNPILIWLSTQLERFLYRQADRVIVNSPGFISHVESRGARQISLVPNGADPAMFDPDSNGQTFREQHALTRSFLALYAGAHGLSNDLEVVLDAAALLEDLLECGIVLLGAGKEKSNLMARAEAMGLQNVSFVPPVPKTEMGEALAAAGACIAILKPIEMYRTVYPNKVFDYLAAGRPVVLAMEGVIREVVEKAQAGINVPPGDPVRLADAIRTLVKDPRAAQAMGRSGRAYVETHFDRVKLAEEFVGIIEEIIGIQR